ncbi:peroxidase 4-like protein [Tanacetum coccineum]
MGASLLRLHFHDCFVNGCDGSVLLDDTPSFTGEKTTGPNVNSARGFNVIDDVKSQVEEVCPGVVSCADVLAITALESVVALGGPRWEIKLGRRDSRTASLSQQRCHPLTIIHPRQSHQLVPSTGSRQLNCPLPTGLGDNNLAPLDVQSPACFDNSYFTNLINEKGLLGSDQQLHSGGATDFFVEQYSQNPERFHEDFAAAMIKMGDISPLTGSNGEIRENCRVINS